MLGSQDLRVLFSDLGFLVAGRVRMGHYDAHERQVMTMENDVLPVIRYQHNILLTSTRQLAYYKLLAPRPERR